MNYQNETEFRHEAPESLGLLLLNLGTPEAPSVGAVRRYLAEFLSDPRVVEMVRPLWWMILHGIILRLRPRRSARAYQTVWTEQGSPLLVFSREQAAGLEQRLAETFPGPVKVALGMRYGSPSVASALAKLRAARARRLLVLPLYPQYSATTTASAFDAVTRELRTWRWLPELRFITQYYDDPGYIAALAGRIRAHWEAQGPPDRLLFSFHGLPRAYFERGDPYYCHCLKTARLTAAALELAPERWQVAFQSRVGRQEWLRPYTDEVLKEWGAAGIGRVQLCCPGFAADCLETLEEIAVENRAHFLRAGGREYQYIPALNAEPAHLEALAALVRRHAAGWPEADDHEADSWSAPALRHRLERARARGAAS